MALIPWDSHSLMSAPELGAVIDHDHKVDGRDSLAEHALARGFQGLPLASVSAQMTTVAGDGLTGR